MESVDLLVLPVMGWAAPRFEELAKVARNAEARARRLRYTAPFNLSGQPTLTLPGGITEDGVPIGFQLVGRSFDEAGLLTAGYAFQRETNWHLRRPPV
jgi:amidase